MIPRREQPAITIRSQKAAERLKLLTRDGRSQAEVIEEALERISIPPAIRDQQRDIHLAELRDICGRVARKQRRFKTLSDFDAQEYDERGNLR